jgi:hypothetical protein
MWEPFTREREYELRFEREMAEKYALWLQRQLDRERRRASQNLATVWVVAGCFVMAWVAYLIIRGS